MERRLVRRSVAREALARASTQGVQLKLKKEVTQDSRDHVMAAPLLKTKLHIPRSGPS